MACPTNTIGSDSTPTFTFLAGEPFDTERYLGTQAFTEKENIGYFVASSGTIQMEGICYE